MHLCVTAHSLCTTYYVCCLYHTINILFALRKLITDGSYVARVSQCLPWQDHSALGCKRITVSWGMQQKKSWSTQMDQNVNRLRAVVPLLNHRHLDLKSLERRNRTNPTLSLESVPRKIDGVFVLRILLIVSTAPCLFPREYRGATRQSSCLRMRYHLSSIDSVSDRIHTTW